MNAKEKRIKDLMHHLESPINPIGSSSFNLSTTCAIESNSFWCQNTVDPSLFLFRHGERNRVRSLKFSTVGAKSKWIPVSHWRRVNGDGVDWPASCFVLFHPWFIVFDLSISFPEWTWRASSWYFMERGLELETRVKLALRRCVEKLLFWPGGSSWVLNPILGVLLEDDPSKQFMVIHTSPPIYHPMDHVHSLTPISPWWLWLIYFKLD